MTSVGSGNELHCAAWDLIPWLVTGRLAASERAALDDHLRICATCRGELATQQRLRELMRQPDSVDYAPGPSLQKLLWRLDEIGTETSGPVGLEPVPVASQKNRRVGRRWPAWLIGLQAAVIVILAIAVLFQVMDRAPPLYRTVTVPRAAGTDLRIMFAPGTTARGIQEMLGASGTVIVDGPSEAGIYSLALAPGMPATAVKQSAAMLRANPDVLFVEAQPP